jgi:phosphotransferase system HPr (HPr) family protein
MPTYERVCQVRNVNGIHARPSSLISMKAQQIVKNNPGIIRIKRRNSGGATDCTSLMGIMTMAAAKGTELVVFTDNANLHQGVDEIVSLIENMQDFD